MARLPYVIDTSVAVKWYIPEAHSAEAKAYIGTGVDRHAPDYLLAEAASVVLKRVRSRDLKLRLTFDEGQMVIAASKASPIQFHETRPLIDPAFALAQRSGRLSTTACSWPWLFGSAASLSPPTRSYSRRSTPADTQRRVRWVEDAPVNRASRYNGPSPAQGKRSSWLGFGNVHGSLSKYALLSDAATASCLPSGLQARP